MDSFKQYMCMSCTANAVTSVGALYAAGYLGGVSTSDPTSFLLPLGIVFGTSFAAHYLLAYQHIA